jgi:hypothetical protein
MAPFASRSFFVGQAVSEYEVTRRNRVRQIREYARYDTEAVHGVLDAGLVSHVGFVQDGPEPVNDFETPMGWIY